MASANKAASHPFLSLPCRLHCRAVKRKPLQARKAWSDSFWPSYYGGISWRWQSVLVHPLDAPLPSAQAVARMSMGERAELSPAEKFDILRGDFAYTLTTAVWRESDFSAVSWAGLCHGWAQAALAYPEPQPVVARSPAGVDIPFASSDVKGLLAYWMGEASQSRTRFVGRRCDVAAESGPCEDLDAGAFHVVLANLLGQAKKGYVVDFDPARAIWNYPVHAYSSRVLSSSPGRVEVETVVSHPSLARPRPNAYVGDPGLYAENTQRLRYVLDIDGQGNITGGSWLVPHHPDFLWTQEVSSFRGAFSALEPLYRAAVQENKVYVPFAEKSSVGSQGQE
ncbi:MAG: hypothetical protein IOD12_11020 [Silvanigrellales bacterium]|nr:hypothetical protein [Silvanigrellales bacterium]